MDKTKINLEAPAFGEGAQTEADLETKPQEETVDAEAKTEVEETPAEEAEAEPERVKYSRFKNVLNRAKEAEEEAAHWRKIAEQSRTEEKAESTELPSHWVKLYGDSPESAEAWKIQREANEEVKREAREEALKAVREERSEESVRVKENIGVIDQKFEELSDVVGRDLTDKEQSALLDIVDEYTPKDEDGNYLAMIPFDKAWEIYELKNQVGKSSKTKARDAVASLSGSKSEGESTVSEKDKNFNPLDWNSWRSRI